MTTAQDIAPSLPADVVERLTCRMGVPSATTYDPQPGSLYHESLPLLAEIRGDKDYKRKLDRAVDDLYDRLRRDPSVVEYISSGRSVLGPDHSRGRVTAFKPASRQANLDALRLVLHSLAHIASCPSIGTDSGVMRRHRYLAVPLSNTANERRGGVSGSAMSRIVHALAVLEGSETWIRIHTGRFDDASGQGMVTRIEPCRPLLDWLTREGLVFAGHPKPPSRPRRLDGPLLRVNTGDRDGDAADARDVRPLARDLSPSETVLIPLNEKLVAQKLRLDLPDYAAYENGYDFRTGTSRLWTNGRKALYRQFSDEDGIGGRLYGHYVQQLPAEARLYLTIDGRPVIEADYRAMQLMLLYGEKGLPAPEGDPYDLPGVDRDRMQDVLTLSVGNATRDDTLTALRGRLNDQNSIKAGRAERLYDAFWEAHEAVCLHGEASSDAPWRRLQYLDSEIALRVLRILLDQGIVAIPIHDSFIVQDRHEEALVAAMRQAWEERFPATPIRGRIKVEGRLGAKVV